MTDVELVLDAHAALAEGPTWHAGEQALYWTNLPAGELHRFDPATGADDVVHTGRTLGCFAFVRDGGFVLGTDEGLSRWAPGEAPRPLHPFAAGDDSIRLNDGKVDPDGRFWVGSNAWDVTAGRGTLRRLDTDGSLHTVLDSLTLPNGLDWTDGGAVMYFADSFSERVWAFDVDDSGGLRNRRDLYAIVNDTNSPHGLVAPDGLCTDADGNIWLAVYGAGEVRCIGPDGSVREVVPVPVLAVTSCAFGGDDLGTLYITTSAQGLPDDHGTDAGSVFAVQPGVRGLPVVPFAG